MCGKYTFQAFLWQVPSGSPPHVREIHQLKSILMDIKRITPACAGNTHIHFVRQNHFRDHPRMCGKYRKTKFSCITSRGSPPHVREILTLGTFVPPWNRITPACAGNTCLHKKQQQWGQDHPRMCGKYKHEVFYYWSERGSPPHVREILPAFQKLIVFFGITPACAGNTFSQINS